MTIVNCFNHTIGYDLEMLVYLGTSMYRMDVRETTNNALLYQVKQILTILQQATDIRYS